VGHLQILHFGLVREPEAVRRQHDDVVNLELKESV
jgi:hypothetical protein